MNEFEYEQRPTIVCPTCNVAGWVQDKFAVVRVSGGSIRGFSARDCLACGAALPDPKEDE